MFGLVLAFVVAEVVVRSMGETDEDGNFFFGRENQVAIGAINPPVEWIRGKIERYESSDDSRMIFDENTGWSPRPKVVTHEGRYRYDSAGIRTAGGDYSLKPKSGTKRIAIYGDSFAHSDDVPFEHSWAHHLEQKLPGSEVINFGVSAYGMDQAYLRWKHLGRKYRPKIVLFGFQAENINRNVNLLRGFYMPGTGIPFSKPRFILNDKGRLKVINQPTVSLDKLPGVMANMDDWPLTRHEWFYNPDDFRRKWWQRSRFVSLLVDRWTEAEEPGISRAPSTLKLDGEPVQVTLQILREFREEVERQGGRFYVVHLPKRSDIDRILRNKGLTYGRIWDKVESEHHTIDPLPVLMKHAREADPDDLYVSVKHPHYTNLANQLIAELVARHLRTESPPK